MCGGTRNGSRAGRQARGLSPRVRGNPRRLFWPWRNPGSIPACAGEPVAGQRAYPGLRGLSPRVRGNPDWDLLARRLLRSIPACAGEPLTGTLAHRVHRVYPRVCGGTQSTQNPRLPVMGLSPRVRGNLVCVGTCCVRLRSIPACAGEPIQQQQHQNLRGVYPRVCGGTFSLTPSPAGGTGLSPRVRGNLLGRGGVAARERSIPACAGEPWCRIRSKSPSSVYPRVCGGTGGRQQATQPLEGLSPRVRGNPAAAAGRLAQRRSIPACAGEPTSTLAKKSQRKVYPRVCGGTPGLPLRQPLIEGLSPRVRGNPRPAAAPTAD